MKNLVSVVLLFVSLISFSQTKDTPVKWESFSEKTGDNTFSIHLVATIFEGFHVYSQNLGDGDGPIPTSIEFASKTIELIGEAKEIGVDTHFDAMWDKDIAQFSSKAEFVQNIKLINPDSTILKGFVNFMTCNDEMCFPPDYYDFEIDLLAGGEIEKTIEYKTDSSALAMIPSVENVDLEHPINDCGEQNTEEKKGNWTLFILGLLGGLVSLFTPCVFPMIPLTVSFFTKGGSDKGSGVAKALLYGFSIVAVYVSLSLPFYFSGTDPEILNQISTSFTLNIIFFVIFVVFAISFFGYYELTLPSSWANKADKAADLGGFIGVIFMALVLAIVSFSCTGPLLGSVLAGSLKDGAVPITFAMLGFGVGLGLPFTIFAAFPSLLKKLPQSGGWLNSVKVVLGFVELGLAVKFLSNADFVYRFGIVHRETFYLVWIILGIATAAYLFGLFKFPHDSKGIKISIVRKAIGIGFLSFAIYLIPGVLPKESQPWETRIIAGFPPSTWYSWYGGDKHFTDYYEALAYAEEVGKPLLVDFTGYACVNCRKMEENVWTVPRVEKLLSEKFVIVSLYVDDKVALPKELQGEITIPNADGTKKQKKIKTVGDKWSNFEILRFGQVSQPYYVLLSPNEYLLTNPVAYTPNSDVYADWLECGLDAFSQLANGNIDLSNIEGGKEVVAENLDPVTWRFSVNKLSDEEYEIEMLGSILEGWHTYSQYLESMDGPLPTWITFEENDNFSLVDSTYEEGTHSHYDETFEMNITDFADEAIFKQKIKVKSGEKFAIKGNINFMVCENGRCLPPKDQAFEVIINQ